MRAVWVHRPRHGNGHGGRTSGASLPLAGADEEEGMEGRAAAGLCFVTDPAPGRGETRRAHVHVHVSRSAHASFAIGFSPASFCGSASLAAVVPKR